MDFIFYDIIFLVVFVLFVGIFLYKRRGKIQKEGLLLLYRTEWGIKLIKKTGEKYKKTLKVLSYFSIIIGYFLMALSLILIWKIFWMYITRSPIVTQLKIPPIMPIIPYIDKIIPGFPSFYFTYFIVILAVIAITHEFSHGIFSAYNKVRIKKTGFGFFPYFFPVFLAAFVEPDEKQMQKKKIFPQMAILSAGTFANLLTGILLFLILILTFSYTFAPSGVFFDEYSYDLISVSSITMMNNISLENPSAEEVLALSLNNSLDSIEANNIDYVKIGGLSEDKEIAKVYHNSPALMNGLAGTIQKADGIKIKDLETLKDILRNKKVGEKILLETNEGEYEIELQPNPFNSSQAWLGIYFLGSQAIIENHKTIIPFIGDSNVFYKSKFNFALFLQNLLEWTILISLSVAIINMLPVGIFDGGRFFYLTVLAITKKEKFAKKAFAFVTYLFLFILLLTMISWLLNLFF